MKNQNTTTAKTAKIIPFAKPADHRLIQAAGAFYVGKVETLHGGACRVSLVGGGSLIFRRESVRIVGRVKIKGLRW